MPKIVDELNLVAGTKTWFKLLFSAFQNVSWHCLNLPIVDTFAEILI
jgi:hypothetical protein